MSDSKSRWKIPEYRAGRIEPTARAIYRVAYVACWITFFICAAIAYNDKAGWLIAGGAALGFGSVLWWYVRAGEL